MAGKVGDPNFLCLEIGQMGMIVKVDVSVNEFGTVTLTLTKKSAAELTDAIANLVKENG